MDHIVQEEKARLSEAEVRALIEPACDKLNQKEELGHRDWWIFKQVLGDTPEALTLLGIYLQDIRECPPEVIDFCRKVLAPTSSAAE